MDTIKTNREYTKFSWQIAFVVAANIIGLLLSLIRLPLLTKNLSVAQYGTWSLLDVTIGLITPFSLIGLQIGIVRFLAAVKDNGRIKEDFFSVLSIVFVLGFVLSILLFLSSDYLAVAVFKDADS